MFVRMKGTLAMKKMLRSAATWVFVFMCATCLGADEKISLAILYAGHPGSEREADFVRFLKQYFVRVGTGDLAEFKDNHAKGFDVVIMDYDDDYSRSPLVKPDENYRRATVTIARIGGVIGSNLGLKTGLL